MVSLLGRGVEILTIAIAETETLLDNDLYEDAVRQIESGKADAVCFTPQGHGQLVLAAPSDVLVIDRAALQGIEANLVEKIQGTGGPADSLTEMLRLQWRLNINGHRVLALNGEVKTRRPSTVAEERLRIASVLNVLTTLPSGPLRGLLTLVAELYLVADSNRASSVDTSALDLQRSPGGDDVGTMTMPANAVAAILGLDAALDDIDNAPLERATAQMFRRTPDRALSHLMEEALAHLVGAEEPLQREHLTRLLDGFGVSDALAEPLHVLVVTPDETRAQKRAQSLVEHLGLGCKVRVLNSGTGSISGGSQGQDLNNFEQPAWADVIVLIAATFDDLPGAARVESPLVVDMTTLDLITWLRDGPPSGQRANALRAVMDRADLVLAADQVQRDHLLGALAGELRVNAAIYDEDPSLMSLIRTDTDGEALLEFCRRPVRAADTGLPAPIPTIKDNDLVLAVKYLKQGGPAAVATRVAGRVKRVYKQRAARKK